MRIVSPLVLVLSFLPGTAFAQAIASPQHTSDVSSQVPAPETAAGADVRREIPVVAYAYSAFGASRNTVGAQVYGLGLLAAGQRAVAGTGGTVWASPAHRLTIMVDGQRNLAENFSPSAAGLFRLFGTDSNDVTIAALGKFKVDGFAGGPGRDEVESEIELGALLSYATAGWHLDLNAIGGRGLGDDGEMDAEGRLRLGCDVGSWLRLGIDGQTRVRVSGTQNLPNGRTWDFAAGPQALVGARNFFGSVTAGPTTAAVLSKDIGWTAMLALGGRSF